MVLARREHVVMLEPFDRGLLATTLRYPYEVREQAPYFADIPEFKLPAEMKDLAAHIVDSKMIHFDPSQFIDHYETALVEFVNAQLLIKALHGVVTVPTSAVRRGAPGTYVYIINTDHTVSVRPIKIGPTDGEMAAVESGLAAGDRVVIDGADRLRDEARVVIPSSGDQSGHGARTKEGPQPGQSPGARGEHPYNNQRREQGGD